MKKLWAMYQGWRAKQEAERKSAEYRAGFLYGIDRRYFKTNKPILGDLDRVRMLRTSEAFKDGYVHGRRRGVQLLLAMERRRQSCGVRVVRNGA